MIDDASVPTGRAIGGKARAASLTPDVRSEIAQSAAKARWSLPTAQWVGAINVADYSIPCAVIEKNGEVQRLVIQREVVGLLTGTKRGNLERYLFAGNLEQFLPKTFSGRTLREASVPFYFPDESGAKKALGLRGEDIVDICEMYIQARKKGVLRVDQEMLADRAEILVRAFAKLGVIGIIDEATGYQQVRARHALEAYLEKIIRKEVAAWVKTFPDEFFKEMHRLKGWPWRGITRRPQVAGHYVNDLVYSRIGPEVLKELQERTPKTRTGNRSHKFHSLLTDDFGVPKLSQHLYALIALMRVETNWKEFLRRVDIAFPRSDVKQMLLFTPSSS